MQDYDFPMNNLGKNLERLLKEKGLNPTAVSKATGKNQQLVADIIKGRSKSPSIETVASIARVLNVPVSQLTGAKPDYAPDVEVLAACFKWILDNFDRLRDLPSDFIVNELVRQYSHMLHDKINDKMEAVRITRYVFDGMLANAAKADAKKPRKV